MKRKLKITLIVLIFLIIVVIGFMQKNKSITIKEEKEAGSYTYNSIINSAPDDVKRIIDLANPDNDKKLNKEINRGLMIETIKLGTKSLDMQAEILEYLSPYLKKVKIDESKTDENYINELKNILAPLKIANPDFNNKESLNNCGDVFISVLNNLSNMGVPKRLEGIHKSEMTILGSMGYIFKKLAITNDPDEAAALIVTLNKIVDIQDDFINKLVK
ncbi:MAG: hypothetical protein ACP5JU_01860 [Minisyncoccia bacterium]